MATFGALMGTQSRTDDAGNTLVLPAGDRRSAAAKRLRTIEQTISAELRIERLTEALRILVSRVAELTLIGEELSDRLVTGKPISIELMGRNTDRLQRAMTELREQATGIRVREHAERMRIAAEDDDDEAESPRSFIRPSQEPRPRSRESKRVEMVVVDPRRST